MKLIRHIPNFITSLNLFTGTMAVYFAFQQQFELAAWAILIAAAFDFMDGMAARMLNAYSPLGKELDSLADLISFGLAPAAIAFELMQYAGINQVLCFVAFIIPVFSALRLAKFNLDERQSASFLGLPTPANGLFWAGAGMFYADKLSQFPQLILLFVVLLSLMLVTELPMFSLKFKSFRIAENKIRYIFLSGCIAILAFLGMAGFPFIILWYIALNFSLILLNQSNQTT